MNLKKWFKKKPKWFKGGLIGLGIYLASLLITLLLLLIASPPFDQHPNLLAPGSLGFLIPFIAISLYPAILLTGSYEAIGIIVPLNSIIYFLAGALIWIIIGRLKK